MILTTISFLLLYAWFAFWSGSSGRSLNFWNGILQNWQDKWSFGSEIPEFVIALTFATFATIGWSMIFSIAGLWSVLFFIVCTAISYAGKQSATWAYLPGNYRGYKKDSNKDGVIDNKDGRMSTMRKFNDWLASLFGMKLGHKYYAFVWAFTKGLITTLPVGGTGAIFMPVGREIAYQLSKLLPNVESNTLFETVGDGFGYVCSVMLFFLIVL